MKKRGFTLLELLIVVTIMVTLMTVMFRLSNVATDDNNRTETIAKLQKLENCLSGYYAAFGSYPPVPVYGSRDIYRAIDPHTGMQTDSRNQALNWKQVQAACLSQPVSCAFPFNSNDVSPEEIRALSEEIRQRANDGDYEWQDKYDFQSCDAGLFSGELWNNSEWTKVQIFKFGLLSFLLPRYLIMMGGDGTFYGNGATACAQWTDNNQEENFSATTGESMTYGDMWQSLQNYENSNKNGMLDYIKIANMPTQAVCGRWMPNLEGILRSLRPITVFGVTVTDGHGMLSADYPNHLDIYSADGGGNFYILDHVTIIDGWWNPLYYYSPVGNQSYTLWSGGPNKYTFPPWIVRENLPSDQRQTVITWTEDDIIRMKH